VHAFAPNGHGLFNVAGNVWEWCADTFSPRYHLVTASENPRHDAPAPTARCAAARSPVTRRRAQLEHAG
jgi:formylglycine-generating enzyme required for sulfatase activity